MICQLPLASPMSQSKKGNIFRDSVAKLCLDHIFDQVTEGLMIGQLGLSRRELGNVFVGTIDPQRDDRKRNGGRNICLK